MACYMVNVFINSRRVAFSTSSDWVDAIPLDPQSHLAIRPNRSELKNWPEDKSWVIVDSETRYAYCIAIGSMIGKRSISKWKHHVRSVWALTLEELVCKLIDGVVLQVQTSVLNTKPCKSPFLIAFSDSPPKPMQFTETLTIIECEIKILNYVFAIDIYPNEATCRASKWPEITWRVKSIWVFFVQISLPVAVDQLFNVITTKS